MTSKKNPAAVALGRLGGKARAAGMTPEARKIAASKAAKARWEAMTPAERTDLIARMQAARTRKRAARSE